MCGLIRIPLSMQWRSVIITGQLYDGREAISELTKLHYIWQPRYIGLFKATS